MVGLPADLPFGWHEFVAEVDGRAFSGALVICPERLAWQDRDSGRRGWGIAAQIYSARSRRSWGLGDLADLKDLAAWSGIDLGADFVQVNPLHAAAPVPEQEPSPYLPTTRRYTNPIYIRVEGIEEFAYLDERKRQAIGELVANLRPADQHAGLLDRAAVWTGKRAALEVVYSVERSAGREAEYRAFLNRKGEDLRRFALWCALTERHGPHWNEWPVDLRDVGSAAVSRADAELVDRIDFHGWLQWIADQQLEAAQSAATGAGMGVGIIHDLAVGVHRHGAETWLHPDLFAADMSVGAPPDGFNQLGQDWSQPPWRPDRLAAVGFAPFRDMLRAALGHAGGLRIDHILGLFRLWWIPVGSPPSSGTYVRYDHEAMLDILILEAHRVGAVVVGEDLGTVEPWVAGALADRGILGTDVLWFQEEEGVPTPVEDWRRDAMVAVTVHDLPPTMGYLAGNHVRLREELGLLEREPKAERAAHRSEIEAWMNVLGERGLVRAGASDAELMAALYRLAAWSPAVLLAVALPDLCGDVTTQNQPGTDVEYANWRFPLRDGHGTPVLLDDVPHRPELARIVAAVGGGRGASGYLASRS